MSYLVIFALIGLVFSNTAKSDQSTCGVVERAKDGTHEGVKYPTYTYTTNQGSAVIVKQDMRVNADGARTAYEVNNHGISYLCDGISTREGSSWINRKPCGTNSTKALDRAEIKNDELHFSKQGPELCIFGFHVEGGESGVKGCSGKVVGGQYADAIAPLISLPSPNGSLHYFLSTTSLRNITSDVTKLYVDSEKIPFIVKPYPWHHAQVSLGDYAYVYSPSEVGVKREAISGERGSFAIIADNGPKDKFGEGSIALHQMLAYGELKSAPAYQKTPSGALHPERASIFHPYEDRRDGDIRAKSNIYSELWFIIFADSANKAVKEHTFGIGNNGMPNGNVHTEGAKAAKLLGGHKHIIECLKNSPNFG